ncbi:MAG: YfcC family protein, partial [Galactobacillus timonensis]|nr:YfcC family protein [Galactobacillus timonensis]
MSNTEHKKRRLGTFGILLLVLLFVAVVTWICAGKTYTTADGETGVVTAATFSQILMAPIAGF